MRFAAGLITLLSFTFLANQASADTVRKVRIVGKGEQAEVLIEGVFDVPTYDVRARDGGRFVVIDVVDVTLPPDGLVSTGTTGLIRGATASTTSRGVRVEVELARPLPFHARVQSGTIGVRFSAVEEPVEKDTASNEGPLTISDLHIERRDGRDRLVVETNRPTDFRVKEKADAVSMEIRDAQLSARLDRVVYGDPEGTIREAKIAVVGSKAVITVMG
ncbi:MAG: hypothetical protein KC416_09595, partial [Myxococcales bacterium]|nr:hypothetical protein [Myxococcales bacterium]